MSVTACAVLLLGAAACGGADDPERPPVVDSPSPTSAVGSAGTAESSSGTFTVSIPEGWVSEPASATSELYLVDESQPDSQVGVASSPIGPGEAELTEYVEGQREQVEAFTNVTEVTEATPLDSDVAGEPAITFDWFFRAEASEGETDLVERRVIFVHEGELYDVKLQAPVEHSDEAFRALDHVLGSWEFTSG